MNLSLLYIAFFLLFTPSVSDDARKANEAYEKGNYAEAEQLYASAIDQDPENARLYFNLGNAQAQQGKVDEATQSFLEFRRLADSAHEKALAEYNIGTMLAEKGEWETAVDYLKNALKLNPADPNAKFNYERALTELQKKKDEQQKNNQNQPPPIPSAYAKAMKKQAEELVSERKYTEAYDLMMEALKADETVKAFNDFINRTKNVAEINENK